MENTIVLDSHLESLIQALGYEPSLARSIVDELLPVYADWERSGSGDTLRAIIPGTRVVIKDEDLQLFDSAVSAVLSAASVGFFMPHGATATSAVSAITGIVVGCLRTGRQILRKGVKLTPDQFELISILSASGDALPVSGIKALTRSSWTEADILRVLNQLQKIRLHDGSVVQLISEDYEGRWGLEDI
jgi:hypothetical protein